MKKYLAVLGRQPKISLAELESLFEKVAKVGPELATFEAAKVPRIERLGGILKIAEQIKMPIQKFLRELPESGKITLGVSDYSRGASAYNSQREALKMKRWLVKNGRSVRVVPNKTAVLSSATSFHNNLTTGTKLELIKAGKMFYRVIAVQDINAYAERDRARPARDAKVGMLPPKLAQILINLCGPLEKGAVVLDPFCGTGVVLQEALLMGYDIQGSDLNPRMVEYTKKNLEWLAKREEVRSSRHFDENGAKKPRKSGASQASCAPYASIVARIDQKVKTGDARDAKWERTIGAVACEGYLGPPMSQAPAGVKLKEVKQECGGIILGFLKNLAGQIESGTPVVMAVPAWLRPDGSYERMNLLDEIQNLSYNVSSFKCLRQEDLLYHREGQVVAREIIVLRKK